MIVKVNINDSLKVKLNARGRDIYYHSYDDLIAAVPSIKPPEPKEEDKDGYSTWQVWVFMQTFGPYIHLGMAPLFESDIVFLNAQAVGQPSPYSN